MPIHATNGAKQKAKRRAARVLVELDKTSGPARFFNKMRRDIAADLGGRRELTRIEGELIKGFAGCATRLEYLNYQILLGTAAEVDVSSYAQLASTMLRIGSRLGFHRRARDVTPTLADVIRQHGEPYDDAPAVAD
jgi:hypothetical protein